MPFGNFISQLPPAVFLVIHLAAFGIGVFMARKTFDANRTLAWGFVLFAAAEVCYMTYHLDWTVFLFAHTISEVLDLSAFVLIFAAVTRRALSPAAAVTR